MVVAVVVTYEPDFGALSVLLESLRSQVGKVVIVDNGSRADVRRGIGSIHFNDAWCEVIPLASNLGIAAAQNIGIEFARQSSASYVVLFDQDSAPEADMVAKLRRAAEERLASGVKVAAVGPRYTDERQDNPPPFIKIRGLSVERQYCCSADDVVEVDYLIASGCLIPIATLDEVGGMREDLFIDYVDIEWGLRAKKAGFQSFGACGAVMRHELGDEPLKFRGRKIPVHSPLRHYYHFRNAIRLYCESGFPVKWKIADAWRLFLKYGFYTLFARPWYKHWWMMSLGIAHGLVGRMGKSDRSAESRRLT